MSSRYLTLSKKMFDSIKDLYLRGVSREYSFKDKRTVNALRRRGILYWRVTFNPQSGKWTCKFTRGGYALAKELQRMTPTAKYYLFGRK